MLINSDASVRSAPAGEHPVAGVRGLFLRVRATNKGILTRRWIARATIDGRRIKFGLGSYPIFSLAQARRRAQDAQYEAAEGNEPGMRAKARQRLAVAERSLILGLAIDGYLAVAPPYKNPKSAETRDHVLRIHFASLHGRDIATITAIDVANILRKLKPQIAIKAHGAVRSVFDYAAARLEPHGVVIANPADPRRLRAVGWTAKPSSESSSHAAVDWRIMPKVISALEDMDDATVACALLIAATAVRAGTARLAKWADFNLEARTWTPPLADLKDGKHHKRPFIVPLNDVALEALERMRTNGSSRYVFGRALTDGDITCLIRKLRRRHPDWVDPHTSEPFTIHGLRASFRTWTEDMRRQDSALAELSLGHKVHGEVSARYVRTGLVEERRALLEAWGRHLHGETAEVVTFPRSRA